MNEYVHIIIFFLQCISLPFTFRPFPQSVELLKCRAFQHDTSSATKTFCNLYSFLKTLFFLFNFSHRAHITNHAIFAKIASRASFCYKFATIEKKKRAGEVVVKQE